MTAARTSSLAMLVVAIALSSVPAPAIGQTGSRQTATLAFEREEPGQATPVRLAIDYVNPSDPAAKPYAVQKVVITLAPGTTIDLPFLRRARPRTGS